MNQRGRVVPLRTPGSAEKVFTVSELTKSIRNALEVEIGYVVVRGEIAELSTSSKGHTYFSLKDMYAQINVVLFASQTTPAIRKALQPGLLVQVEGDLQVYEKRSEYQIKALHVAPVGEGALQAQFEALKKKLTAEGLFEEARKRPLPRYPTRIGIVTSTSASVLQDMLHVFRTRAPYLSITTADTRVQGEGVSREIAAALARMSRWGQVDVIIVARGGGSLQELWAFNEEPVVRAIVASRIPVISAVGHETDFTLADLAADHRSATPTKAAQDVVKDVTEIRRTLQDMTRHARTRILSELDHARSRLRRIEDHHALRRPERRIQDGRQTIDDIEARLSRALGDWVVRRRQRTELLAALLRGHSPSKAFDRARDGLERARSRAAQAVQRLIERKCDGVLAQMRLLEAFDHHRVLERGYALVWSEDGGRLLKRGGGLRPDDAIQVQFFDARAKSRILEVRKAPEAGEETT